MAPRRNNSLTGGSGTLDMHSLLVGLTDSTEHLDQSPGGGHHQHGGGSNHLYHRSSSGHSANHLHHSLLASPASTSSVASSSTGGDHHHTNQQSQHHHHHQTAAVINNYTRCCVPASECFKAATCAADFGLINMDDLRECVRVVCSNEHCAAGQYMHAECFESWEQGVLTYLKSIGRARSWSERQRIQNLWTKKGYDLVFKACGCKCGRGHLKKDLEWSPPMSTSIFGRINENGGGKKSGGGASSNSSNGSNGKKKQRNGAGRNGPQQQQLQQKSAGGGGGALMAVGSAVGGMMGTFQHGSPQQMHHQHKQSNAVGVIGNGMNVRHRAGSVSSSNGSTSPLASGSSEHSVSPVHLQHNNASIGTIGGSGGQMLLGTKKQKCKVEAYSDRVR